MYSDLAFLFRPWRADPYNAAGNGLEGVILWNDLDGLSASQFAEIPAKSEAVRRAIDNQARKSLGFPSDGSDHTRAPGPDRSLGTPAVGDARGGHRFRSNVNIPGLSAILPEDIKTNNREIAAFCGVRSGLERPAAARHGAFHRNGHQGSRVLFQWIAAKND